MADTYVQTCFAFDCTASEWALLQQAFLLSLDLNLEAEPEEMSSDFRAVFPPTGGDPWSGFRELFDDPDYPDFGADLAGGETPDEARWQAIISAEVSFDPAAVSRLIQRCCAETLSSGPIGFEWSISCSRQRIDEFGGGWCAVFADRIELEGTHEALRAALLGETHDRRV
ncbi:hypothetical protein KRR38_01730 [Novosphingobium sp. G106]|uniref:hypothetical protein n=1 Tax=Novosphingobium sp. G106 TaxID=2849500 RepID=UPI001C2D4E14|nr:hypothetical protein [Novosphingobium sp. G106]MBV1686424.1 hypothetical protein [Novosphingobium sp. G106]